MNERKWKKWINSDEFVFHIKFKTAEADIKPARVLKNEESTASQREKSQNPHWVLSPHLSVSGVCVPHGYKNIFCFIKAQYEILILCLERTIEVLTLVCPHNSWLEVNTIKLWQFSSGWHKSDFSVSLNTYLCFIPRFSIDRSTDQEQIFNIDPVTGAITLGKILDRETAGWHNLTVTVVEAGTNPVYCTPSIANELQSSSPNSVHPN